jgi:glutamine synthetase
LSETIDYVEMRFVDLLGHLKAMIVPCEPADSLEALSKDPSLRKGTSIDGSSIAGMATVESSDLRLDPDISTLVELPYTSQRTAAVMCFVKENMTSSESGLYHPKDSRGLLFSVCNNLLPGQMHLNVKVEPEFYFITEDGEQLDSGHYADTYPANPAADVLLEIATSLRQVGIQLLVAHHEAGEAQQEIEIDFDDVKGISDSTVTFRNIAHAVARDHGLDVTFMPKPFLEAPGSGLHAHLQLWDGNQNVFGSGAGSGLSEAAENFVAGLLEHARAITAIANPSVNSYKRLVPHMEAPVYISWGYRNRTTLVRIPLFKDSQKAAIEIRSPDSTCNPYLLFSAIIAAGMDGVERGLSPPEPRTEDVFGLTDEERDRLGIGMLPSTLEEALRCLEQDTVIKDTLGLQLFETYLKLKREEWREYTSTSVTDWEWDKYSYI